MGQIHVETLEGGPVVVTLEGEHELYGARTLQRRLDTLVGEGLAIVVDLTSATFLDSSVVSVLLATRKRAWDAGVRYAVLVGPEAAEPVRRMFEITHLDTVLPVVHNREAVLQ